MSQLKLFQSTDVGAPALNGLTGSLLTVLNYCLYSGSGWTKPLPDSASIGGTLPSVGLFQQGTGSRLYLAVNDGTASSGAEARICGWENITTITQSTSPFTGSNSFPVTSQGVSGAPCLIARKSNTVNNASRFWMCFADSSSMYFFAQTTDTVSVYYGFMFGDIYSYVTSSADNFKCMIIGRTVESSSVVASDRLDQLSILSAGVTGHYIARSFTGTGISTNIGKHGDATKGSATTLLGTNQYPNSSDGGLYLSPVWVCEPVNLNVRGEMRGFYQVCHPVASFADGQIFSGSGDYAGKIFQIVKYSGNSGIYCIETSNTVEINTL